MRDKSLPQSEAGHDGKGVWGRDVEDKTSHTQRQPGRSEEGVRKPWPDFEKQNSSEGSALHLVTHSGDLLASHSLDPLPGAPAPYAHHCPLKSQAPRSPGTLMCTPQMSD